MSNAQIAQTYIQKKIQPTERPQTGEVLFNIVSGCMGTIESRSIIPHSPTDDSRLPTPDSRLPTPIMKNILI
ncbi:hypothetical protein Q5692_26480 [Microcoleus sp. C2C3]|uniref:hypothetical protein n=1 Tax=unclassified Microcoleus TaxID=2642155 RepID=UPI002FD6481D